MDAIHYWTSRQDHSKSQLLEIMSTSWQSEQSRTVRAVKSSQDIQHVASVTFYLSTYPYSHAVFMLIFCLFYYFALKNSRQRLEKRSTLTLTYCRKFYCFVKIPEGPEIRRSV